MVRVNVSNERRFVVRYWGVRGSVPTPGRETARYGGNTTCIEIRCDDEILIIDNGTGARKLGNHLMEEAAGEPVRATILFSHLHLDHVQGFPFFRPIYEASSELVFYAPVRRGAVLRKSLATQMAHPSFPVGIADLPAQLDFRAIRPGAEVKIGPARVRTCALHHPGGALGIRIDHAGHAFMQCSDMEHQGTEPEPTVVELAQGVDYLSYDSMYAPGTEYERFRGWGHSTWRHGMAIADAAAARNFIAFHHEPGHDDDFMDRLAADIGAARPGSVVAHEGMTLDLLAGTVSCELI